MIKNKQLSRRDFLRASGLSAGILALRGLPLKPARMQTGRTITVLVLGNPYGVMLGHVLEQFTEQTGIGVNLEIMSSAEVREHTLNAVATSLPEVDVVTIDQPWLAEYVEGGQLIPLDPYIRADSDMDMSDFIPEVVYSLNTYRGHLWTLPVDTYCQGVMYRTDLFDFTGLAAPPTTIAEAGDWTWDRYIDSATALHGLDYEGKSIYGTVICGAHQFPASPIVDMFAPLAMTFGARWYERFPDEIPWNFNPTVTSNANLLALDYFRSLYTNAPPEALDYTHLDAGLRFARGDIGIFFWYSAFFTMIKDQGYFTGIPSNVVDRYGIAPMPTLGVQEAQTNTVTGLTFGIPSSSSKQDEAWQFIKWSTGFSGQKAMALVPDYGYQFANFARRSLFQDLELRALYPHLDIQLSLLESGRGNKLARPPVTNYVDIASDYGSTLRHVLAHEMTSEEALDAIDIQFRNRLSVAGLIPFQGESYEDTLENTRALIESLST